MLPVFIADPELRAKAAETFSSEEFQNNIEEYFVNNIKVVYSYSPSQYLIKCAYAKLIWASF